MRGIPPFAKYAKDGAPLVLLVTARSKAWATRRRQFGRPLLEKREKWRTPSCFFARLNYIFKTEPLPMIA